jgi:hypothetical protein
MSDTPETDALDCELHNPRVLQDRYSEMMEHAQKLERERDEAREALEHITEYGTEEINAAVELRQKLAQALVDLDNMHDQRDLAMKVISRKTRGRNPSMPTLGRARNE